MHESHLFARDTCNSDNSFDGENMPARISSVFVVLALSALGSFLPILGSGWSKLKFPSWFMFVTRYVGSGVIVATGYIHLLAEADEALTNPCLGGVLGEYPWAEGFALIGTFCMFFLDIVSHKKIEEKVFCKVAKEAECRCDDAAQRNEENAIENSGNGGCEDSKEEDNEFKEIRVSETTMSKESDNKAQESIYQQILNSFVLEFGIVFHSVFVGLSLAIAGKEFRSLYAAIAFHQMFEGLGLGARFAMTPWPKDKAYVPFVLALCYSLTTPIAIAIGLGVRKSYPPGSRAALITTGVFDGLCGGILIYNSLVELMAFDFMSSNTFKGKGKTGKMLLAFGFLTLGAFLMAVIGKWA